MTPRSLPRIEDLTRAQHSGWACCWCGASLMQGGISAGRAEGGKGAHAWSVEVYACTSCATARHLTNSRPGR